jgi:hypothetical protein
MRKQGLVHLHALCTLLREHVRNREDVESEALDGGSGTASPAAIHRPKADHRRAVDELATEVATAVDPDDGAAGHADSRQGTETTAEGG